MKKLNLLFLVALSVAGCHRASDEFVADSMYYETDTVVEYATPSRPTVPAATCIGANLERDLVVETDKHVIQMVGQPDTKYEYRVWIGDTDESTDPDVIVNRGTVMVRTDDE